MYKTFDNLMASRRKARGPAMPATDTIVQMLNAFICLLALFACAPNIQRLTSYLLTHVGLAAVLAAVAALDQAHEPRARWLGFVHDWLPALIVTSFFFELGVLIPHVRTFDDYRYDHMLGAVDVWLLGDPDAVIAGIATPWLSEILTVCYLAYYPLILIVPAVLYARGQMLEFQCSAAILLCGFALTYAGYFAMPAVGPHWLSETPRTAALAGYGFAGYAHAMLRAVPVEPPDAFPSGHALVGMLAPALAFRFCRPLFLWLLPLGVGAVLATIYLRYHYILDVIAAAIVAAVAWRLASALHQARSATAGRTEGYESDTAIRAELP